MFSSLHIGYGNSEKYSRGRRGAPAKGVGRETGARVQIPLSPLQSKNKIKKLKKLLTKRTRCDIVNELPLRTTTRWTLKMKDWTVFKTLKILKKRVLWKTTLKEISEQKQTKQTVERFKISYRSRRTLNETKLSLVGGRIRDDGFWNRDTNFLFESLILAQDERWRRA